MNELEKPFFRLGNPTLWGIGASVLVTAIAVWLSSQQTCSAEVAGFKICQTKLSYLKTAPPNEVGDALAGVAGVLAFIWIIVTVALQAEELRAQREVLRLTRDEMEEQRKAAQDMARSLSAQASIFEDEKKGRDEARADSLFAQLLRSILIEMKSGKCRKAAWYFSPFQGQDHYDSRGNQVVFPVNFSGDNSVERQEIELAQNLVAIRDIESKILDASKDMRFWHLPGPNTLLDKFVSLCLEVEKLDGKLSPAEQQHFDRFDFSGSRHWAQLLMARSEIWSVEAKIEVRQ